MSSYWEIHDCGELPKDGIQILYSIDNIFRRDNAWRLIIRREATAEDLMENHHLEEEGETIWETSLEITHCPYCGKYLYENRDVNFKEIGNLVHYDLSGWKLKKQ